MTISTIVGVGLCSTRQIWFSGRVEPYPYSQLLMRCLQNLSWVGTKHLFLLDIEILHFIQDDRNDDKMKIQDEFEVYFLFFLYNTMQIYIIPEVNKCMVI